VDAIAWFETKEWFESFRMDVAFAHREFKKLFSIGPYVQYPCEKLWPLCRKRWGHSCDVNYRLVTAYAGRRDAGEELGIINFYSASPRDFGKPFPLVDGEAFEHRPVGGGIEKLIVTQITVNMRGNKKNFYYRGDLGKDEDH